MATPSPSKLKMAASTLCYFGGILTIKLAGARSTYLYTVIRAVGGRVRRASSRPAECVEPHLHLRVFSAVTNAAVCQASVPQACRRVRGGPFL